MEIPNLFTQSDEAERLYTLLLARLDMYDEHEKVLEVTARIRQHAAASVGINHSLFTYSFDRDANWYLKRHDDNWESYCELEKVVFGRMLDLPEEVTGFDQLQACIRRSPLHFACRRFTEAAKCQEQYLAAAIRLSSSLNLVYNVLNDDEVPTHPVRVTLKHIYQDLGKPLTDWRLWPMFVEGLPNYLLKDAKTSKSVLLQNPDLLLAIMETRQRRLRRRAKAPPDKIQSPLGRELLKFFPFVEAYPYPRLQNGDEE